MRFILLISLLSIQAFAQTETIEQDNSTNIYNTYNSYYRTIDTGLFSDPEVYAIYLDALKTFSTQNQKPYGCTWSILQIKRSDGSSIPFYQCK